MSKRILSLSLCLLLVLSLGAPLRASADGPKLANEDELMAFLAEQRAAGAEQIDFEGTADFYRQLSDNEFSLLQRLCVKAGVDDPRISYSDSGRLIRLSWVTYTDRPWAEVGSEEALRTAVLDFAARQEEGFTLLCTPELCARLYENGRLSAYLAQGGMLDYVYPRYNPDAGIIRIKDLSYTEEPCAVVEDYAQFSAAISAFEQQGIDDFTVVFTPELFEKISSDAERLIMEAGSSLDDYGSLGRGDQCAIHYYRVKYNDMPRLVCRDEDDVVESIRRVGAAGFRDFELVFPYKEDGLFDRLSADNFALLIELQTQAGMTDGRISYSFSGDRIQYSEAEIVSDMVPLDSLEQAVAYVEEQVAAGAKDLSLFCSQELYRELMGDLDSFSFFHSGMNRIYDLLAHAGVCDYDLSSSGAAGVISVQIKQLFPGTAIVQAARSGDGSGLSARELETWTAAAQAAEAARSEDPWETARAIHDWLCEHVVYTIDEDSDEDDTAIGAILNGKANCDGYTDAFYLIGTLAGLNVRYQHGDSYDKGMPSLMPATHIWNLLELDGQWRMVDVTWDDDDEEGGWSYIWFNVGQDLAGRMHFWNEDMTVPLAAETVRRVETEDSFYVSSAEELDAALAAAEQRKLDRFRILFVDTSLAPLHEQALDRVGERSRGFVLRYSWEERMCLLSFHDLEW